MLCLCEVLPDSFSGVVVGGDLDLSANKLMHLPDGMEQLRVGGELNLQYCSMAQSYRGCEEIAKLPWRCSVKYEDERSDY